MRRSRRAKCSSVPWVEVENEQGDVKRFRIVGPDEIYGDTVKDYISIDSPMARALIKKRWMTR